MNRKIRFVSAVTLLFILGMLLAACGGTTATTPAATTAAETQATTAPAQQPTTAPAEQPTTAPAEQPTTAPAQTTEAPTNAPAASATEVVTGTENATATTGTSGTLRTPEEAAKDAAGGQQLSGTLTVLGTWGGNEQDSFLAMVKPFEDATGVTISYEGTRDLNAVLTTRVQGGNPPDLAGLPGPGQMAEFAKQGKLIDLSTAVDTATYNQQYAKSWVDLGTVDGKLVGIFIKSSVKGLIWYDPKVWSAKNFQPPKTWDDMMTLSKQMADSGVTPWCIGLESGAASGWPGTDWLEDIVLRQAGPDKYDQWYQGKLAWTSPEIKQAWQTWGQIVGDPKMVYGGANSMLTTNFGNGGDALFTNPLSCYMHHQASFITDFFVKNNPNLKPVQDFSFFGFPSFGSGGDSLEAAGDLFGMFKDSPQARALIKYLTTPEAQAIWVKRGGAISPNKQVPASVYPDDLSRQSAQLLTSATAVRFDASDLMPEAMNNAFWKAILDYVQSPDDLDSILQNLDSVQKDAYKK